MNNLLSYCWLFDARISACEKYLPVIRVISVLAWDTSSDSCSNSKEAIQMNTLIFYNIFPTQESNVIYGRSPTDFTILTDFTSAEPAMVASTFKEDLNILKDAQTHPDPSKVCMPFLHLFSATHFFQPYYTRAGGRRSKMAMLRIRFTFITFLRLLLKRLSNSGDCPGLIWLK